MLIVGELINGMYKSIAQAVAKKDKAAIQRVALDQVKAGACMLDLNVGPYEKDPVGAMNWLVETVQEVTDAGLSIDSTRIDVIKSALTLTKKKAMINSANADDDKLQELLALARKHDSMLIALTMTRKGVPKDKLERMENAAKIITVCTDIGLDMKDLFLDPIVLPVNVAQADAQVVIESVREFSLLNNPPPNTIVGLSNISQRAGSRSLINMTYLVMLMANGLTAAIINPLDKQLMDALVTAELLLNKNIYCESFLTANRNK